MCVSGGLLPSAGGPGGGGGVGEGRGQQVHWQSPGAELEQNLSFCVNLTRGLW